ncbi:ABC transporter ATP-binding protein [Streptomyces sp. NPDC007369]|uniref:ABC transporter ATP-binding protein n=1 Tax=Streptomyces sp. NPDC007369 TaxID=3154589 RepID=UPI0033E3BAFD
MAACTLAFAATPVLLVLHALVALAIGLLPVLTGWATKLTLDRLVAQATAAALTGPALLLVAAGLTQSLTPHALTFLRSELDRRVGLLAQGRLFAAVGRIVGLGPFEDPVFLDRLRLAKQSGRTSPNKAAEGVLGTLGACVTLGGFVASLAVIAPLMTVFVLLFAVPVLVSELALSRRRARTLWTIGPVQRRELFYDQLMTTVAAAKEVRLLGIGDFLLGRMQHERRTANAALQANDRREVLVQSALSLLAATVAGAGLLWAVRTAFVGDLTVGDVAIFIAAVAGVQGASAQLAAEIAKAHHAATLFRHYLAVTGSGGDLPVRQTPAPLPRLRRGIEFQDVSFRYSGTHPWVLRHLDLRIPAGESVALVGLNGAGKSTLVKLLCRFYDPTGGRVLWDGIDIRDVDPALLRERVGAVFQDYMHYDLPAREAVGLGDLSAMEDLPRIQEAARRAGVHETLRDLPHGYETLLTRTFFAGQELDQEGEHGVMLSGGQDQRLALARAFLRDDRDLLILDEPSSGLDAEAEHEIHTSLRRYRAGRTSLLISHRLGSVRDADRIVVLSDGAIAEQGTHDALMLSGGEYARLFSLQASGYREEQPAS